MDRTEWIALAVVVGAVIGLVIYGIRKRKKGCCGPDGGCGPGKSPKP